MFLFWIERDQEPSDVSESSGRELTFWFRGRLLIRDSLRAVDVRETREVADGQRPAVARNGGSSISGYGVCAVAERPEVPNGVQPDLDTISGIVGDRNATELGSQIDVGALFQDDAGAVIAAEGSSAQLQRRVFCAGDAATGNYSSR